MYLPLIRQLFVALAALMLSTAGLAQSFRTYLSASGSDANPCTLIAPCRLLPAALSAVISGGEIWMIDSANYNVATVAIGKSVSILAAPGVVGSIVAAGGPAISITAPGLTVALRNVVVVPLAGGGGTNGAVLGAASTLIIENGVISNLPGSGVVVNGGGTLKIANTVIRNNSSWAVALMSSGTAEISNATMLSNGSGGVTAQGGTAAIIATVSDSVISGGVNGVFSFGTGAGASPKIFLARSTVEGTAWGLISQGSSPALVSASNSMVVNNGSAWYQSGSGVIQSLGNNHFTDNGASTGSLTPIAPQ